MSNSSYQSIMDQMLKEQEEAIAKANAERHEIAQAMLKANVQRAHIEFSGYGDDGSIHTVNITPEENSTNELEQRITEWCYLFLEGTGVDWVNNDGGHGEITFDISSVPWTFTYEINQNETISHLVQSGEEVL